MSKEEYSKGEYCWADLGPTLEEYPLNPNPCCFTLVWVPKKDLEEELPFD